MSSPAIGGGAKKVLYTLDTVRRIGPARAAKALTSHNTCKACALGMGGQRGGMTNELGEFPSVCNKSVQAQSTDIQPAIPEEIFTHALSELRELSGREMEQLGRLDLPLHKPAGGTHFTPVSWEEALSLAADRLRQTDPDRSFFYSSGRSSNEAGFLFQLVARLFGTNNVSNCSYYCHQATSVALAGTIGTGTATIELEDLDGCDTIFVIGANPASNHPRFIHKLKGVRDRGGDVIIINPARESGLVKFAVPKSPRSLLAGGTEIASAYLQPRIGADIALLTAIAKAVLEMGASDNAFLDAHTAGADAFRDAIDAASWADLVDRCGVPEADIRHVAEIYARSNATVFAWGMGLTHHLHGVENIEAVANLALLRGMLGRPQAGLLPLRGHSNVQGIGTIGVKPVLADDVVAAMERRFGMALPEKPGLDTMAAMQAAHRGEIDAAVIMGGNLYAANPNAIWAAEALDRIGFKLFLTTTLNQGHVHGVDSGESLILPVTARDEEWEPTTQESMFNFVRLSDGGIERLANCRPESVILSDLAHRILPDAPIDFKAFGQHREIRKAIAAILPEMAQLEDIDVAKQEFHIANRVLHAPDFKTASGRAHFTTPDPTHLAPAPKRDAAQITLTTLRSEGQFNSIIYEERDSYRGTDTRWCVMLNAKDMAALALEAGDRADLVSSHGRMEGVTVYAFDLPRGCAMAYYPEANLLTGTAVDPRSKTPAFKSTEITVRKAVR